MAGNELRVASGGEPLRAPYTVVLTHDVDHLSMRALPFLSRAQLALVKGLIYGNLKRLAQGRIAVSDYLASLATATRLPLAALGLARDPWEQSIKQVMRIEEEFGARSTFFFMPFAGRAGHVRPGQAASENRASYYRLSDYAGLVRSLVERGWEVGIHGIDCHISPAAATAERAELAAIVGDGYRIGVRMHWLYSSPELRRNLAQAGCAYDATPGWNDRIGFPRADEEPEVRGQGTGTRGQAPVSNPQTPVSDSGSSPAYLPFPDPKTGLAVLPLNIQDVALLREDHMGLKPEQAWKAVEAIYANNGKAAAKLGWQLRFDTDEMMRTAWLWEQKLANLCAAPRAAQAQSAVQRVEPMATVDMTMRLTQQTEDRDVTCFAWRVDAETLHACTGTR